MYYVLYPNALHLSCIYFQIGQDVALIIGQNDIKSVFCREWMKYITGILTYGEKSTKKESMDIIRNMDNTGIILYS